MNNTVTMQNLRAFHQVGTLGDPLSGEEIRRLFRQAKRYQFAAKQDMSLVVQFLHNSYAVAYLAAIRDLATDQEIDAALETSFREFGRQVLDLQDTIQARSVEMEEALKASGLPERFGMTA